MSSIHQFKHEAMKTTFSLLIESEDAQLAQNVANVCIAQLDAIENTLSRYVEGSDVWQINHMHADQTLFLSEDCYDCLCGGLEAHRQTNGLFDITLGRQIEHRKNDLGGPAPDTAGQLIIDPDRPAIHCREPGREIDLGGIGKGFALDRMRATMDEWGIKAALLSAGSSTQLAFGPKAWKIQLTGDHATRTIELKDQALSASGTGIQGSHIVSPDTTQTSYSSTRIWFIDTTAALADAWSTAALLMTPEELTALAQSGATLFTETKTGLHPLTLSLSPSSSSSSSSSNSTTP